MRIGTGGKSGGRLRDQRGGDRRGESTRSGRG